MKKTTPPSPTLEDMVKAAHEAGVDISFGLEAHSSFYGQMEDGVREWVRMLRNAGINTVSSCHHEGYVQAQSSDPTTELRTIFNVLQGRVKSYEVIVYYGYSGINTVQHLEIRSPDFKLREPEKKPETAKKRKPVSKS